MSGTRVIVGGFVGLFPTAGGVAWDYLQYPLGLAEMGCDVYYVEDTGLWPVFQESDDGDATPNVRHLATVMEAFGLGDRWAYRDEVSGRCFGLSEDGLREVCRSADVLINISCSTVMRDEYFRIPARALIDSDPMFTQVQHETRTSFTPGEPSLRALVDAHTHHFTFAENIGSADCLVPDCGIQWRPTRQPVSLRHWATRCAPPADGRYTTVMNWTVTPPLRWAGRSWGQKDLELLRFLAVPERVRDIPLAIAVGQTTGSPFPEQAVSAAGWEILDPVRCAGDWQSYRRFIQRSKGEFSVAKQAYVDARTGWFSCRSACYLAASRPVITQDTGWTARLPHGRGLLGFTTLQEAEDALRAVNADWTAHAEAARRVAEEEFRSDQVLADLMAQL